MRIGFHPSRSLCVRVALLASFVLSFIPAKADPPASGMRLWLKADAGITPDGNGRLSAWNDQSVGNYNAIQNTTANQPLLVPDALNGKPVVRFSGNQWLDLQNFMPGGAQAGEAFVILRNSTTAQDSFWNFGSREEHNYYLSGGRAYENFGSLSTRYQSGTTLIDPTSYHLYGVAAKTNEWVSRQNGRVLQRVMSNTVGFRSNPILGASHPNHSDTQFSGDIAEVIVYDHVLTDADRELVGQYLSIKYALIAVPAAPSALSALALSNTQVSLAWTAEQGTAVQFYEVERKEGAGNYTLLATPLDVTGYLDNTAQAGVTYSYRVRTRNYSGVSGYSNESTVTTPTDVTASMPTNGIKLWLKADAGLGTTNIGYWPDQSGVDRGGAQALAANQPMLVPNALNGRPVVRFSGNQWLDLPNFMPGGAQEGEAFVVLKNGTTAQDSFWNFGSREEHNYYLSGGRAYENFGSMNTRYQSGTTLLDPTAYHLYGVSAKASEWVSRQNGRVLQRVMSNTVGFRTDPILGASHPNHSDTQFNGDIAEVIVYDHVLTDAERQAVGKYVSTKYALIAVPTAPSTLSALALSNTQVSLAWTAAQGTAVQYYEVERKEGAGSYALLATPLDVTGYLDNSVQAGVTYSYRVRTRNYSGVSGYSNESTVTTPTDVTASMPTNGIKLWLKADAGLGTTNVGYWPDQSGVDRGGAQALAANQPVLVPNALNGRPVVRFSGNQWLDLPDFMAGAGEGEAFVVLKNGTTAQDSFWNFGSREEHNFYLSGGRAYENFGSVNTRYQSGTTLLDPAAGYHLYGVSAKTDEWVSRQNGRVLQRVMSNTVGFRSNPILGASHPNHSDTQFNGDIAEVIVYDHVLTDAERQAVGKYVSTKYALIATAAAPSNLSALALSNTQVSLAWTAEQGTAVQYYEVERKEGAGSYALLATPLDVTGYLDNSVQAGVTYSYRVRTRNYSGVSGYSNESTVTTPTDVTASMPTNGIKLWLKADAGLGTTNIGYWPDQSGADRGGVQALAANQPVLVPNALNGRPVVRFSGNQWLDLPNFMPGGAQEGEAFVVLKNGTAAQDSFWNFGSREEHNFYLSGGRAYENFGSVNTRYQSGTTLLDPTAYHLYGVSAKASEWVSRQNGRVLQRVMGNTVGFRSNPILGASHPNHGDTQFNGDIAEVIVYDHVLTDAERQAVGKYVSTKYALIATPVTPSDLNALALNNTQVTLAWTAEQGTAVQYYEVERKEGAGAFALIATTSDVTGYLDSSGQAGATYSYRVRTRNYSGVSSYSNVSTVTMPTDVSGNIPTGIKLWLRADAGLGTTKVAYWPDQSGADQGGAQALAANQPVLVPNAVNGLPVVRFSGNQWLDLPNFMSGAGEGEAFVVLKNNTTAQDSFWNFGFREEHNFYLSGGRAYENFGSANTRYQSGPTLLDPAAGYHLYGVAAKTDEWVSRQNGRELQRVTSNVVGFRSNPILGASHPNHGDTQFNGDLAEVIVFDHVLSDAEREAVHFYIFRKYGFGRETLSLVPSPGFYSSTTQVSISSPTAGAEIYYTLDGTTPIRGVSALYTGPLSLTQSTRVRATAYVGADIISNEASGLYRIGAAPEPVTALSGLSATYYQGANFAGSSTRRLDAQINQPSLATLPAGWQGNAVSARWDGEIVAQFAESHTFYLKTDGGVRVWFGGDLVIDDWSGGGSRERTFTRTLASGAHYPVRLEYQRKSAGPELSLEWFGFSTSRQIVPPSQFISGLAVPGFVATPVAAPAGVIFADSVSITLASNPTNASIYYTFDGSEPTPASAPYLGPLSLAQTATLKTRAYASGYNESGVLIESYTLDNTPPTLSNLTFNNVTVPATITVDGTFRVTATDSSGVKRVEFHLDGQLLAADTIAGDGFTAPFSIGNVTDGAHTLTVQAWDMFDAPSTVLTVPLVVTYPSPPAPTITSPTYGRKVNTATLTVRGTAAPGSTVVVYRGATALPSILAGADGAFSTDLTLLAGLNTLTATAQNRNPQPSASSAPIQVTYDNTVPGAAGALTARSLSDGRIALEWRAPVSGLFSGYYIFRSTDPIAENTVFDPVNSLSGLTQNSSYTDTPPTDGHYYYRVVVGLSVGADVTLSAASNQADAFTDRTPPSATVALQPLGPLFDASGNRYGVGLVKATVTVSEPLLAVPFFNLTTAGGLPIVVDLSPEGGNVYSGTVTITTATKSGPTTPKLVAYDLAGNRGTACTLDTPLIVDVAGPVVTGLMPVSVDINGQLTELPQFDTVRNDTPATLSWRFTLDELPKVATTPVFTAVLSGHPNLVLPVTVADAGDADARTWLVTLTLPADAGTETENLTLGFSANDDFNNVGTTIIPPHVVQVYQGALPPLSVPGSLTAEARAAGVVHIGWNAVAGAAGYVLQVKAPGEPDFVDLQVLTAVQFEYTYTPAVDGDHDYRVASVRILNSQQSTSGWSNVATVRADRVPPPAPTALTLAVIPQGIEATWTPPAPNLTDVAGYSLYRSGSAISDVSGLTPAIASISKLLVRAVDARPVGTAPYYALVAFDAAGNRSAPATAFGNVGLLPVRTLSLARVDTDAPVLTWTPAPGSVIDGYHLFIDGAPTQVNGADLLPVALQSYTDNTYSTGSRTYNVRTVSGAAGQDRSLLLPEVSLSVLPGAEIKRGLMNVVTVHVQNHSAVSLFDNALQIRMSGHDHLAADLFDLAPGAEADVPVVIGGYEELPEGTVPTEITFTNRPADGETVTLTRNFNVRVAEGALTAEVLPGEFTRGGTGTVRFKLTNPSALPIEFIVARQSGAQPSDEVRINLLNGNLAVLSSTGVKIALGENVVALPNGRTVVRVPAGGTYVSPPITVPVPSSAGASVTVVLEMDAVYSNYGQPTQVSLKGPRAQQVGSTQQTSYSAEVTAVTPQDSNGDQPIVISGRALWRGIDPALPSALAPNSPVIVYIGIDGFVRQQALVSDASGAFTYSFVPGPTEKGGIYQVWASHPDITSPPDAPATFTIRRVSVSPQNLTFRAPRNYRQDLPVTVKTSKGTTIQNLRAVLVGTLPEALSFSTTPVATISPEQTVNLPLSLVGLAATGTSVDFGTLQFRVVSDDGAGGEFLWATLNVSYEFTAPHPYLQATPGLLEIGVQPAQVASEILVLKNVGYAPLEETTLSLVSTNATPLPAWIRLQTAASLGTIDVGQSQNVVVSAAPPLGAVTDYTVFSASVHVTGANGTPQDFPVNITVSPSGEGSALLKVVDPYFLLTLPNGVVNPSYNGVPGASIVLEQESNTGIPVFTQSAQTDANGEIFVEHLPAGRYKLRINADKHDPYVSRITIKPGVVYADQIALGYVPVTFTWSVVPVPFQDRYELVLTTTFVTDVPVPVLVVEPGSITLPKMCAGQVYNGEFRITNYGLIDAEATELPLPEDDEFFSYEFLSSYGDKIKAKQTVTVAYRVKCLKALPDACPEVASNAAPGLLSPLGAFAANSRSSGAGQLGANGSVLGNGDCGTYGRAFSRTYVYHCPWNGQTHTVTLNYYFSVSYGTCITPVAPPSPDTVHWTQAGGPIGGGGPNVGGSKVGGGRTTPDSDECFPPPPPPPPCPLPPPPPSLPLPPTPDQSCPTNEDDNPNPDPNPPAPCNDPRNKKVGSWVDMTTRQFSDQSVDLSMPVPGGQVKVTRVFNHRRWSFVTADHLDATALSDGSNATLLLRDRSYRLVNTPFITNFRTDLHPVSDLAPGVYRVVGSADPDAITKLPDSTFVWTDGQGSELRYDTAGRVVSAWYQGILICSYLYNGTGELSTIADRDGRPVLTFTHTNGNLTQVQDVNGRAVSYSYDGEGRLATCTSMVGTVTTYTYDGWWHMTGKRVHLAGALDADDLIETIEYKLLAPTAPPSAPPLRVVPGHLTLDEKIRGMVSKVSKNTGEAQTFAYQYNQASQTYYAYTASASGVVEESVFDPSGNLLSKSINGEPVIKIERDAHTRVTTTGQNQRTTEEFDDRQRLVRKTYPDGSMERFEYDNVTNALTRQTARSGAITAFTYDALLNVLTKTEAVGTPLERVTTSEYYPGTRLLKLRTAPGGQQTAFEYNAAGSVTREYNPADPLRQTVSTYDSRGLLATVTDANGNLTSYTYDAEQRLIETTNPLLEKTINKYQGKNLVEVEQGRVGATPGRITRTVYDSAGRRIKNVRVDSAGVEQVVTTYAYDADGRLISETNALGQAITYRYDESGNRAVVSVPSADGGRSESFTKYDALGRIVETIDAVGTRTTTVYGSNGRPVLVTEAAGTLLARSTSTTYDSAGRVTEQKLTDLANPGVAYTTTSTYDLLGRRITTGGNRIYPVSYAYDSADRVVSTTDALGRITTNEYDAFGQLSAMRLNGVLVASSTYDRIGNVLSSADGEGNHSHIHYDGLSRSIHESIPLSSAQTIPPDWWTLPAYVLQTTAYNGLGQPTSVTRYTVNGPTVNQAVDSTAYDDFGRVHTQTDSAGSVVTFNYDAADNVVEIIHPPVLSSGQLVPNKETFLRSPYNASVLDASVDRLGNMTHFVYDQALRVVEQTNSMGGVSHLTYDALGRATAQTDPAGHTTTTEYDCYGQPLKITHPDHVAGTHERIETFRHDSHGKLLEKSGAGGYPLVYRYDAVGNMTELQDGNGRITRWSYTPNGQVAAKTYADGTSHIYTYDLAGHIRTRRDALGRITTYGYNAYGLPVSVDYPSNSDIAFTYDQQGRRLSMSDGSGLTTWTYDASGRPLTETQGRSHRTLTYSYDAQSLRTGLEITSSDSGVTPWLTGYSYDNAGRLRTVLDDRLPVAAPYTYAYAPDANLVASITTPTGLKAVKTYDSQGRLLSTTAFNAQLSTLNSYSYTYDAAGQRDSETASIGKRDFTYDAWRQLTQSVKSVSGIETDRHTYAFDLIGNRLEVGRVIPNAPLQTTIYTPNVVNQYSTITGTQADTPTYDSNGNTTAMQGLTLTYDEENRLIEAASATQRSVYVYDGFGRRVEHREYSSPQLSILTAQHRYVYDGWRVMEELDASYSTVCSYTRGLDLSGSNEGAGGIGGLLAMTTGGATPQSRISASYFYDGNGNVTDLAFDDGTAAAHYEYSPFGERLVATGSWADTNPYQFNSKERDSLTGFSYYGFRYYQPATGRWSNRDPKQENGGVNLYGFVENDPIEYVDPLGNFSFKELALKAFQLNGGVSFSRTFPAGAIGPVPIFVTIGAQGKVFKCKNNGHDEFWAEVDFIGEAFGRVGYGWDDRKRFTEPKGRDRNVRVPDPYNPGQTEKLKNLTGKLVDPKEGFRDRSVFSDISSNKTECNCPKPSFEGSVRVFLRGSIGAGFIGGQASIEQYLLAKEDISGPEIKFTAAVGITGATIEAGFGAHAKFTGPLPGQN